MNSLVLTDIHHFSLKQKIFQASHSLNDTKQRLTLPSNSKHEHFFVSLFALGFSLAFFSNEYQNK